MIVVLKSFALSFKDVKYYSKRGISISKNNKKKMFELKIQQKNNGYSATAITE